MGGCDISVERDIHPDAVLGSTDLSNGSDRTAGSLLRMRQWTPCQFSPISAAFREVRDVLRRVLSRRRQWTQECRSLRTVAITVVSAG